MQYGTIILVRGGKTLFMVALSSFLSEASGRISPPPLASLSKRKRADFLYFSEETRLSGTLFVREKVTTTVQQ